jgi:hypothetical protein
MNHSAKIVSAIFYEHALAAILAVSVIHAMKREQSRILVVSAILAVKADFHCCVFGTHVHARKTLNPSIF